MPQTTPRPLTPRQLVEILYANAVFTRDNLREQGLSGRQITAAVRTGNLIRLRRDRYGQQDLADDVAQAVRIGGRLTCLSVLKAVEVFVLTVAGVHVHVERTGGRLRRIKDDTVHWVTSSDTEPLHVTPLLDAIEQALYCQAPRASVATLDSLVHHRLVTMAQLRSIFGRLPARFQPILSLVDSSAGSGPETFVRLMLRTLGVSYETQVRIPGVGYVDFVIEGWLIIECDSKAFHEGWDKQKQDRYRDIASARQGYVTVRPLAEDILYDSVVVQEWLREIITTLGPRFTSA